MPNQSDDKQFVGASIPDNLFQVINLYSLVHGDSKSHILKEGLQSWIENNNIAADALIQQLVWDYQATWRRMDHSQIRFEEFIQSVEKELSDRKVSQKIIDILIKKLKNEKN